MTLKISDVVTGTTEKDVLNITECLKALEGCRIRYGTTFGPQELDILKREFIAHLQRLGSLYSKIRAYKGANHNYCEEEMKKVKAETLKMLKDTQQVATLADAERIYPMDPSYKEKIELIRSLIRIFVKVETLYNHYNAVLQALIQSISVAGKDSSMSNHVS